jgi:hypothetical protein
MFLGKGKTACSSVKTSNLWAQYWVEELITLFSPPFVDMMEYMQDYGAHVDTADTAFHEDDFEDSNFEPTMHLKIFRINPESAET